MIDTWPFNYDAHMKIIIDAQEGRLRLSEAEVDRSVNTILGMSKIMDDWKRENNVDDNFRKKSIPK